MLDDIWTTRRWIVGVASFALVALALVVGLLIAGDEGDENATAAAPVTTTAAGSGESGGGEGRRAGGSCAAAGADCGPPGTRRESGDGAAGGETSGPATAPEASGGGADLSPPEQGREVNATEPNANPDHYGPGGEPEAEPSLPAAEGVRGETAPNRNPDH